MTIPRALCLAAAALSLAAAGAASADDEAAKHDAKASSASTPAVDAPPPGYLAAVRYIPPRGGRPARTIAGATRSAGDRLPALYVLVPDHVGYTTAAQPSLFYYVDGPAPAGTRVEFTLIDHASVEPDVKALLAAPRAPGIQRVDLAGHGFRLEPGVEYEWSIAILVDPNDPAQDVVATGWIQRRPASAELQRRLGAATPDQAIGIYAGEGLWYDAITALGDQIARKPGDPHLNRARASLLRQVGLERAAE